MKKRGQFILSLFLALSLVLGTFPAMPHIASAAGEDTVTWNVAGIPDMIVPGQEISATFHANNTMTSATFVTVTLAAYDGNKMVDVATQGANVATGESTLCTLSVTIPDREGNYSVKPFVWRIDNMMPFDREEASPLPEPASYANFTTFDDQTHWSEEGATITFEETPWNKGQSPTDYSYHLNKTTSSRLRLMTWGVDNWNGATNNFEFDGLFYGSQGADDGYRLMFRTASGDAVEMASIAAANGDGSYAVSVKGTRYGSFAPYTKHTFTFHYDNTPQTLTVYLDGVKIADSIYLGVNLNGSGVNGIYIANTSGSTGSNMWMNDYRRYSGTIYQDAPTETPTVAPTEAPTPSLTDAPTEAPTAAPTPEPTPTPVPTPEPTEEPIAYTQTEFTFHLDEAASTSAGVYDEDGHLVKTLWSAKRYAAGDHTESWNGTDEWGAVLPDGNYTVKVLSSNVAYTFNGLVGNVSNQSSEDTTMRGYDFMSDMALGGQKMYFPRRYSENANAMHYFNISDPHTRAGDMGWGMVANKVATDGNYVYWGIEEATQYNDGSRLQNAYVIAMNTQNGYQMVDFGNNQTVINSMWGSSGSTRYNAIALESRPLCTDNRIGGMAVQKQGNYLFVTYTDLDQVSVIHKTTGQVVARLSYDDPTAIATDPSGNVWLAYTDSGQKVVRRFAVSSDGTVFTQNGALSESFANPLDIAVSPQGTKISVVDGGSEAKMKIYSGSTLNRIQTYGTGENYEDDPKVKDGKLLFWQYTRDMVGTGNGNDVALINKWYEYSFTEFEDENTVWLADTGNYRVFKMDLSGAQPTPTDQIAFLQCSYNCYVNQTDPTRLHSDFLEFKIDYSKDGTDGFWTLDYNYGRLFKDIQNIMDIGSIYTHATTLQNGCTYFGIRINDVSYLYGMSADRKHIWYTGTIFTGKSIQPDGSLRYVDIQNDTYSWMEQTLTGFDANNNPQWAAPKTLASIYCTREDPFWDQIFFSAEETESGYLISQRSGNGNWANPENVEMHLGGIKMGDTAATEFEWEVSPATFKTYIGAFPTDGACDMGNGVWYSTSMAHTMGRNVVYQYYGEGWRNAQTNKFLHFYDDGLLVGVYGVAGNDYGRTADQQYPGNSFSWNLVRSTASTDVGYIFQNSESSGGIFCHKITGLDSISEQAIPVVRRSKYVAGVHYETFSGNTFDETARTGEGITNEFSLQGLEGGAVRFSAFYQPQSSGSQNISVQTDGTARMWVNGKTVISAGGQSGSFTFEAGVKYPVILEVQGGSTLAVSGTNGNLYTLPIEEGTGSKTVNLLAGLPLAGTDLTGPLAGWSFDSSKVNVSTNRYLYDRDGDRDIFFSSRLNPRDPKQYVTRTLGAPEENIASWTLDARLLCWDWLNAAYQPGSEETAYGQYFDVLDDSGRVIARFFFMKDGRVYGNDQIIYEDNRVNHNYLEQKHGTAFNTLNDLVITADENGISFRYADGQTVSTTPWDASADWSKPANIRIMRFNEVDPNNWQNIPCTNIGLCLDIARLMFTKNFE